VVFEAASAPAAADIAAAAPDEQFATIQARLPSRARPCLQPRSLLRPPLASLSSPPLLPPRQP